VEVAGGQGPGKSGRGRQRIGLWAVSGEAHEEGSGVNGARDVHVNDQKG
jgi:hypothetical protein